MSRQDILDDLESQAMKLERNDFAEKGKNAVDRWLSDWGCSEDSLRGFENFPKFVPNGVV